MSKMLVLHCNEVSQPSDVKGQELPRLPQAGVTGLVPIAASRNPVGT